MLLLALSCLQGRPMQSAAEELLALGADGLQLTSGCSPTPAFAAWVRWRGAPFRTHDGFSYVALRQPVWDDGIPAMADSVHPPLERDGAANWLDAALAADRAVEVMYPGWCLGGGEQVSAAMHAGLGLAVDVSHLHLQLQRGALSDAVLARLLDYERIVEVHVSANDGRADRHWVLDADSYGLDWARERAADGVPVVCESYLHRVRDVERRALVDLVRERARA